MTSGSIKPHIVSTHDALVDVAASHRRQEPRWGGVWIVLKRRYSRRVFVWSIIKKLRSERSDGIRCLVLSDAGMPQLSKLVEWEGQHTGISAEETCGILGDDWEFNERHTLTVGSAFDAQDCDLSPFEVVIILSGNERQLKDIWADFTEDLAEKKFVILITERRPAGLIVYGLHGPHMSHDYEP